jgi:hypothetical protein
MSSLRNPVGPQPSSVYWRRRLFVGLGIVALIVIIVLIIVKPGSREVPTPAGSSPAPSASAPANETPVEEGACAPADVEVTAVTDKASYKAGENPQISLTIENTSSTACTFSVGPDVQVYTITSGEETMWTSSDCDAASDPVTVTLEPGKSQATTPITWDRTRSSAETCDADRPAVTAGGASYHLTAVVNDVESAETKQFLLY